ncbi:LD-carboxypeptidase [candidate division KSB1 bacterium]|nr:LD-carboxypeptidase [candidate division KSB1 bacterium]
MKLVLPPKLKQGDLIGVVSPASPPNNEKKQGYKNGLTYLYNKGYRVLEGRFVHNQDGYLAGTDEQRSFDFNFMLNNPEIKAIFCSRGGYGTPRILEKIDYRAARKSPKIIVGYSDITALQLALYYRSRLVTFSGPMVAIDLNEQIHYFTDQALWNMLTKPSLFKLEFNELDDPVKIYTGGSAEGRLLGGCLSVISAMLGTNYLPRFKKSVLFLEDVGEDLYKIDRYFAHLYYFGILKQIKGLVLGQFVNCSAFSQNNAAAEFDQIISKYTKDLGIPVVGNIPYGHSKIKMTFPVGGKVKLDTITGTLELTEPVINEK